MADSYGLLYRCLFYDLAGYNNVFEIEKRNYSGVETDVTVRVQDLKISHLNTDKETWDGKIIQSKALSATLFVPNASIVAFSEIFDSDYKDYRISHTSFDGNGSFLNFRGWLNPENLTKPYVDNSPNVEIRITAVDGLANLKDEPYSDEVYSLYSSRTNLLQIVKNALFKTGIELDFKIQLNTWETNFMLSTECALKETYIHDLRLIENGQSLSCYEVIELVLFDFNVKLTQEKGYYEITKHNEVTSYEHVFAWSTLALQQRVLKNRLVNLSLYKFNFGAELQKIKPIKTCEITFRNKDLGTDLTGQDLTALATWDFDARVAVSKVALSGRAVDGAFFLRYTVDANEWNGFLIVQDTSFSVTKVTENDYFKIKFYIEGRYTSLLTNENLSNNFLFSIGITNTDTNTTQVFRSKTYYHLRSGFVFESPVTDSFRIKATGNYKIYFILYDSNGVEVSLDKYIDFYINNIEVGKIVDITQESIDQDSFPDITEFAYDRIYSKINEKGVRNIQYETKLADSNQSTEIGALLLYNGSSVLVPTLEWKTYTNNENDTLLSIRINEILNNNARYKDYVRITIQDKENPIHFNSILTGNGKYYVFVSYTRDYVNGTVEGYISELIIDYESSGVQYGNIFILPIDSINGENTSGSKNVNSSSLSFNELDYFKLVGRTGGQTARGGTGATDKLILQGTTGNGTGATNAIEFKVGNNGATLAAYIQNNGRFHLNGNDLSLGNNTTIQTSAEGNGGFSVINSSDGFIIDYVDGLLAFGFPIQVNGGITLAGNIVGARTIQLHNPSGTLRFKLVVDANEKLNITDASNVKIFQMDSSGTVSAKANVIAYATIT